METLIINIPDQKSDLVKQILTELGVTIQQPEKFTASSYKKTLANMRTLSDEDMKSFDEAVEDFKNFKIQEW